MSDTHKTKTIEEYRIHEKDTGSTDVQVAILTERIKRLTGHMVANKHDFSTQRGLLKLVGQRKRLLNYLSQEDLQRYHQLIKRLGLRK